jgi:hypothetical protein
VSITALPDGSQVQVIEDAAGNRSVRLPRGQLQPPTPEPRHGSIAWYVPYTAVHPHTVKGAPSDAVWVDVSGSNIAYYAALLDIWERRETFAVLEHDVVCRPDIITELEACPEPWCLYGYTDFCHEGCREAWRNQLGCTRFRAELIQAVPDAMTSIPESNWDWHEMCNGLGENLRAAGCTHHWHGPPAEHHRQTHRI